MRRWSIGAAALTGIVVILLGGAAGCNKTGTPRLTLKDPGNHTLTRGKATEVKISVSRENYRDPVTIKFEDLPKGVTVKDTDTKIATEKDSGTFNLEAAGDAPTGDYTAKVTATGTGDLKDSKTFKLTVQDK